MVVIVVEDLAVVLAVAVVVRAVVLHVRHVVCC